MLLRQHCASACQRQGRPVAERPARRPRRFPGHGEVAGQRGQQGGFAGTVGTDQRDHLTDSHLEVTPPENLPGAPAQLHADSSHRGGAVAGSPGDRDALASVQEPAHAQPPCCARVRRSIQKNAGPPIRAVIMPNGRSALSTRVRAPRSAARRTRAPAEGARAQQHPMSGAEEHAHQVRDHQPHEHDDSGEGHRSADEYRHDDDRGLPNPLHVDTEVAGNALSEREEVELGGEHDGSRDPDGGQWGHDGDGVPCGASETAELPEDDLIACGGIGDEREERDESAGDRVDGDAGQDDRDHLGPSVGARQHVDERCGDQSGYERGPRERPARGERAAEHDDRGRADRGTRGHPDHAGFGERVGEDALQERAGATECGADEHREHGAREPHLPQRHFTGGMGGHRPDLESGAVQQAADYFRRTRRHLSEARGHDGQDHQRRAEPREDDSRAPESGPAHTAVAGRVAGGGGQGSAGATRGHAVSVRYSASTRAASTFPVSGPKLSNIESSMSTMFSVFPAGVCATPGRAANPSGPPTDSRLWVMIRITSGADAIIASLVIGTNWDSRPATMPASRAPAAASRASAPEPGPPSILMAEPRRYRKATVSSG